MFALVSSRYERASMIVTSNKPFSRWGEIFGDDVVAAAMIDRLVHHAEILNLKGDSYRLKDKDLGSRHPPRAPKSGDRSLAAPPQRALERRTTRRSWRRPSQNELNRPPRPGSGEYHRRPRDTDGAGGSPRRASGYALRSRSAPHSARSRLSPPDLF